MQNIKFTQLTDDVSIQAIGDFFKKEGESTWRINLDFYPKQTKSFLTISNAPVLVRKRTLNPTSEIKPAGLALSFDIENTLNWEVKKLAEYPVADKVRFNEKEQLCFVFKINSGISIYLPQFELARALFLHDAYLSRTALESASLKAEFDVTTDSEFKTARINILPSSGYPRKSLDDYQSRRLLSWILIDKEARSSFESIGWYQTMYSTSKNGWNFQFKPPPLRSVKLAVRGWKDKATNTFVVYEISAIQNITVNIPETVEIYHPKFVEKLAVKGTGVGGMSAGIEIEDFEIQEGESANSDQPHNIIQAPSVKFSFANPFKTIKVAKKGQNRTTGAATEETPEIASNEVSIEEPTRTGELASADWNTVSDETEDVHLYANKFDCFQKMLDHLVSQHGCIIKSNQILKLPHLARCKKHLLSNDGNPRCIAVIEILVESEFFYILEVDTSDAINSLSTQILLLNTPEAWDKQLIEIERALIKKSLVWPNHLFTKYCGVDRFKGVLHPKSSASGMGLLDPESIEHWADRLYRLMKVMCSN
jgi:hypothetical protein